MLQSQFQLCKFCQSHMIFQSNLDALWSTCCSTVTHVMMLCYAILPAPATGVAVPPLIASACRISAHISVVQEELLLLFRLAGSCPTHSSCCFAVLTPSIAAVVLALCWRVPCHCCWLYIALWGLCLQSSAAVDAHHKETQHNSPAVGPCLLLQPATNTHYA